MFNLYGAGSMPASWVSATTSRMLNKGAMMQKADAERECIRRWRELPRSERSTPAQANAFAASLVGEVTFETSGDRAHFIRGWLQRDLQLRGGL